MNPSIVKSTVVHCRARSFAHAPAEQMVLVRRRNVSVASRRRKWLDFGKVYFEVTGDCFPDSTDFILAQHQMNVKRVPSAVFNYKQPEP
jgi:hypothetical protein